MGCAGSVSFSNVATPLMSCSILTAVLCTSNVRRCHRPRFYTPRTETDPDWANGNVAAPTSSGGRYGKAVGAVGAESEETVSLPVQGWVDGLAEWVARGRHCVPLGCLHLATSRTPTSERSSIAPAVCGSALVALVCSSSELISMASPKSGPTTRRNCAAQSAGHDCESRVSSRLLVLHRSEDGRTLFHAAAGLSGASDLLCDNNLSAFQAEYQDHVIQRYRETGVPLLDANSGFEPVTFTPDVYARWKPILQSPWRFAFDRAARGW